MSIDLEDWFQVYNLSEAIPYEEWDRCESRVADSTRRLLELFARRDVRATFFVLGWVAERQPDLIREVADAGHEIGSHGYAHRLITHQTPEQFAADLERSRDVLRAITGHDPRGYRAPSFSVTAKTLWATDEMGRQGLAYDSSVFPVGFHPDYGIGDAPLTPYRHPGGLLEVPMGVATVRGRRVPCSGGGYFRLLPYAVTRRLIRRANDEGRPVVFYLHPWEVDPGQPRVALPRTKAIRHYTNLDRTLARLDRLLGDFAFAPVAEVAGA
jgi:polysaccharide deacetylase family protein (PEP-CTERM system associated)